MGRPAGPRREKIMKKEKIKLNRVSKLTGDLSRVQMLFKEVLQQLPEETAKKMIDAIRSGGEVQLTLRENSRGRGYKVAFTVVPIGGTRPAKMRPKWFMVEKGGAA
jgi:hypothetical protein